MKKHRYHLMICLKIIGILCMLQSIRILFSLIYFNYFPNRRIVGHIPNTIFILIMAVLLILTMRKEHIPFFSTTDSSKSMLAFVLTTAIGACTILSSLFIDPSIADLWKSRYACL